jgi:hypothetical protein
MHMMRLTEQSIFTRAIFAALLMIASSCFALSLEDLSNRETSNGLKAALEKSSTAAVGKLGVENGFLNNAKVKIHLPGFLEQARPLLKLTGLGHQLDELELAMNRAAESAVPLAKPLLINAIKRMTFADAKKILTGGDTSVTDFFKEKTSSQLAVKFLPVVKSITNRSGLSGKYDKLMAQASRIASVPEEQASVEAYVTQRTLDGLFYMIGEEEKAIRKDPLESGSKIIGKVFGVLK